MALVLRPSAECLGDVCECSDEGLYLSRPPFQTPVMSPFFRPHQSFGEVTLDDIRPYFQPPRYPIDNETDSNTRLTLIVSVDSDPSEPSYLSYHVETDPSEPSYRYVMRLTSDSSSSSVARHHTPPLIRVAGSFIRTLCLMDVALLEEDDVVMLLPMDSGTVTSRLMSDVLIACGAEHEDSPFCL